MAKGQIAERMAKARAVGQSRACLGATELLAESNISTDAPGYAAIRDRAAEMPARCVRTYLRAMQGRAPKAAVKAMCQLCMGWADYRAAVNACTSPACPLFPYRPYQDE